MKKTTTILAISFASVFAYAVAVSHVIPSDSSDQTACGDSDAKKKKGDNKDDEKS